MWLMWYQYYSSSFKFHTKCDTTWHSVCSCHYCPCTFLQIYEKVQKLREKILVKFPDVRDGLNQFEIPQSVKDAERLMQQHLKLKEFFVNLFAEIDVLIDELTSNLEKGATNSSVGGAIGALPSTEVLSYLNSYVHRECGQIGGVVTERNITL